MAKYFFYINIGLCAQQQDAPRILHQRQRCACTAQRVRPGPLGTPKLYHTFSTLADTDASRCSYQCTHRNSSCFAYSHPLRQQSYAKSREGSRQKSFTNTFELEAERPRELEKINRPGFPKGRHRWGSPERSIRRPARSRQQVADIINKFAVGAQKPEVKLNMLYLLFAKEYKRPLNK